MLQLSKDVALGNHPGGPPRLLPSWHKKMTLTAEEVECEKEKLSYT